MKERFEGADGHRNMLNVLLDNHIVQWDSAIAEELISKGELVEFSDSDTIIAQGASDTEVYFILSGAASVFVNNRLINAHEPRGPRDVIGEMVTLDSSAPRSATVKAVGHLVVLKVLGVDFEAIAQNHPVLWRSLGKVISERLRQRSRFHRPQNERPIVFIGSSTEGLEIAKEVQAYFKHEDKIIIRPWTSRVFGAGGVSIDDLMKQVDEADFALFVFTPDDHVQSRGTEKDAPRDNVIFEMGLFISRLSRHRTFMLYAYGSDLKIPSDLLGITPVTYVQDSKKSLAEQLQPTCHEFHQLIRGLGAL